MGIEVKSITTKFGTARIGNTGYWRISSSRECNHMKYLHRLFYEDYHKCTLLPNAVIHHKDGNKLNNQYENLELISHGKHMMLHLKGENSPMWGKHLSDEIKEKIRQTKLGTKHSEKTKLRISRILNTSGYRNVCKEICKTCKQGFRWKYLYYEDGKQKSISSISIEKLEKKVKEKGLPWNVLNEEE